MYITFVLLYCIRYSASISLLQGTTTIADPVRIAYAKFQTRELTLPSCLTVVTLPLASVSWWEETFLLAPPLSCHLPPPQLTQQMSPSLFPFLEAASSQSRP